MTDGIESFLSISSFQFYKFVYFFSYFSNGSFSFEIYFHSSLVLFLPASSCYKSSSSVMTLSRIEVRVSMHHSSKSSYC
ncbi:hypothetical protein VIGAN_03042900 [Vigna angularis var. angularis]|uniref:Uncharacterized protein n=1 Tax=Vigna angularis var. angularis TaxID=157739 RepID=A0A0S3RJN7_PHAAN|nr:hypothetical protein VIGAN_03042900 [Vigna angularis var. angularis]